jgi:hypothetical protein
MVSNQTGMDVGILTMRYPGRLGHLFSPGGQRGPWAEMPYALDNGAWPAFKNGAEWSEPEWRQLLAWSSMSGQPPLWALVPDVVADRRGTMERWDRYVGIIRGLGFRPCRTG